MGYIIRFADHGQDFLEWELSDIGVVLKSRPFQTMVWKGCVVNNPHQLGTGDTLQFGEPEFNGLKPIIHPVIEVVHTTPINLSAPVSDLERTFKASITHWTQQDFEEALRKEKAKREDAMHQFNRPRKSVIILLLKCIEAKIHNKQSV